MQTYPPKSATYQVIVVVQNYHGHKNVFKELQKAKWLDNVPHTMHHGGVIQNKAAVQFWETHLNLRPGGGDEVTVRTLESVRIQVCPLVVLHVRASMKRLHADSTGKPLSTESGRAHCRRGCWSFAAQLREKTNTTVWEKRYWTIHLYM